VRGLLRGGWRAHKKKTAAAGTAATTTSDIGRS
jgi:hypothetical protein